MASCPHCGKKGKFYRNEPTGYVGWHEWAEAMGAKGYVQEPCPNCGRLTVWKKKAKT